MRDGGVVVVAEADEERAAQRGANKSEGGTPAPVRL